MLLISVDVVLPDHNTKYLRGTGNSDIRGDSGCNKFLGWLEFTALCRQIFRVLALGQD